MRLIVIALILLFNLNIQAQSPIGVWVNLNGDDEAQSHIEVFELDGKLFGKVIKLLPDAKITHCKRCKGKDKGASLLDIYLLRDLSKNGDSWGSGMILDPSKGKEYKCKIWLDNKNTLNVRGYIGAPVFGKTHKWFRLEDYSVE